MRRIGIALIALCILGITQNSSAATMRVQIEKGQIRQRPSFLAKVIATAPYGTTVQTTGTRGSWTAVTMSNAQTGWIPTSALTSYRLKTKATQGQVGTSATTQEISLAGKGFNEQVEQNYKQRNRKLRFDLVDQIEKRSVSQQKIEHFIREGQLRSPEGAR